MPAWCRTKYKMSRKGGKKHEVRSFVVRRRMFLYGKSLCLVVVGIGGRPGSSTLTRRRGPSRSSRTSAASRPPTRIACFHLRQMSAAIKESAVSVLRTGTEKRGERRAGPSRTVAVFANCAGRPFRVGVILGARDTPAIVVRLCLWIPQHRHGTYRVPSMRPKSC
eukprot:SAG11_NODE_3374_length_2490_cov_1.438310_3_plen_165_part_00